ncbi:hypothetical protein OGATHE_006449 [Ogataea polymorpha]|uniref:Uncharacterized protein n=1 Tax=Ogataea polymorpha TaxID=460523 RepID=A0A9P8NRN0_9ASCO|nr:hypothetical protein OGATHE_006449 [Ogataea polymorpha]
MGRFWANRSSTTLYMALLMGSYLNDSLRLDVRKDLDVALSTCCVSRGHAGVEGLVIWTLNLQPSKFQSRNYRPQEWLYAKIESRRPGNTDNRGGNLSIHQLWTLMETSGSADLLQNTLVCDLAEVGALDFGSNTVQGSSQGVLGRCVHHLGSDTGGVWRPLVENNLVSLAVALADLVLEVVDGVPTVVFRQVLDESVVGVFCGGGVDDDLGFGVIELVDDRLELLAELQVVESLQGLVGNSNTKVRATPNGHNSC